MPYEEDIEDQIDAYFQKIDEEEIDKTLKKFFNYMESSYEIKNRTLDEKSIDIYNTILLIDNHLSSTSSFFDTGFYNLATVLLEVNEDIEISTFLSVHGKYRPAKALLRRWLETTIHAIYHDWQIEKNSKNFSEYDTSIDYGWEWLTESPYSKFKGKKGILDKLIDSNTDSIAQQLLNEKSYFKYASFREYIETLYSNLSKCVHFGGIDFESSDELNLEFAKYDKELFEEWYTYLNQINEICNILIFLKFPEILTLHKEHKVNIPVLEKNQMTLLEKLLRSK